jgi:hypothetical protein
MKSLVAVLVLIPGLALAGSITIQDPTIMAVTSASCGYSTMPSTVTGFDSTGSYVLSLARGYVFCPNTSRTPGYTYWCMHLQFDLAGNFISATAINPTKGAPYGSPSKTCPFADASQSYTNAGNYTAYSVAVHFPYSTVYYPALSQP